MLACPSPGIPSYYYRKGIGHGVVARIDRRIIAGYRCTRLHRLQQACKLQPGSLLNFAMLSTEGETRQLNAEWLNNHERRKAKAGMTNGA